MALTTKNTLLVFSIGCFVSLYIVLPTTKSKDIQFKKGEISFHRQQLTLKTEIAMTRVQLETGLMFRKKLLSNQGMLLIFKQQNIQKIWMKNMLFPLDMVFISSQNQVVSILKNLPPCLKDGCITYKTTTPSKIVLELKAGKIDQYKIKIGDKVSFLIY